MTRLTQPQKLKDMKSYFEYEDCDLNILKDDIKQLISDIEKGYKHMDMDIRRDETYQELNDLLDKVNLRLNS